MGHRINGNHHGTPTTYRGSFSDRTGIGEINSLSQVYPLDKGGKSGRGGCGEVE